jgi:hypothetical protein
VIVTTPYPRDDVNLEWEARGAICRGRRLYGPRGYQTLHGLARDVGISARDLSAMECGRIDPTELERALGIGETPGSQAMFHTLDTLGGTANIVAARLEAEECHGSTCKSGGCPVAIFLEKQGYRQIAVTPRAIYATSPAGEFLHCVPPPAVANFVAAFDRHEYESLNTFNPGGL